MLFYLAGGPSGADDAVGLVDNKPIVRVLAVSEPFLSGQKSLQRLFLLLLYYCQDCVRLASNGCAFSRRIGFTQRVSNLVSNPSSLFGQLERCV
jgi:hypothetical protein